MSNLIDLNAKRRERAREEGETQKLYVSHTTGKISGSQLKSEPEFGERLERIRASLQKINRLMADLKAMSKENDPNLR